MSIEQKIEERYANALEQLQTQQQYRQIPRLTHQGQYVSVQELGNDTPLINIASNDYLAIGANQHLQAEFFDSIYSLPASQRPKLGSTSSRLLTGNDIQLQQLEKELENWYQTAIKKTTIKQTTATDTSTQASTQSIQSSSPQQLSQHTTHTEKKPEKSALVFNSGYHCNLGILPALTALPVKTLILADKLVHASIIDGIRLSGTPFKRYRHNDHAHLKTLLAKVGEEFERILLVTESVFSMDGDLANLPELIAIKNSDPRIELYVDEAHSVGVFGTTGLGLAEATGTLTDIDYLVGTFGKSFASMGAYLFCSSVVKEWLINRMRPLIYSTALPPITHAWNRFILEKMPSFTQQRQQLAIISAHVRHAIEQKTNQPNPSQSPIIPYILGENHSTMNKAQQLQQAGFYALPIRPPTVPVNTARIRLVMNAEIDESIVQALIANL